MTSAQQPRVTGLEFMSNATIATDVEAERRVADAEAAELEPTA